MNVGTNTFTTSEQDSFVNEETGTNSQSDSITSGITDANDLTEVTGDVAVSSPYESESYSYETDELETDDSITIITAGSDVTVPAALVSFEEVQASFPLPQEDFGEQASGVMPEFGVAFYPQSDRMTYHGLPFDLMGHLYFGGDQPDGVSRSAPPDPIRPQP